MSEGSNVQFSEREALLFHSGRRPGKIEIVASKPMATQRDLSLAYSPGVAVPVLAIAKDPATAYDYTVKGNLVAVISNGTAILGLGRSEEHTSELQSLMRISYAVFCLKKQKNQTIHMTHSSVNENNPNIY